MKTEKTPSIHETGINLSNKPNTLVKTSLLEFVAYELQYEQPDWNFISNGLKSTYPQIRNTPISTLSLSFFNNMRGKAAELWLNNSLENISLNNKNINHQIITSPVGKVTPEISSHYKFNVNEDLTTTVVSNSIKKEILAEYDALVILNDVFAIFEIKAINQYNLKFFQRIQQENVEKIILPLSEITNNEYRFGCVIVLPENLASTYHPLVEDALKRNIIIAPFYTDILTFDKEFKNEMMKRKIFK